MSTVLRTVAIFVPILAMPWTAMAHPGHGEPGPTHYVTEPVHVLPAMMIAATIFAVVVIANIVRGKRVTR